MLRPPALFYMRVANGFGAERGQYGNTPAPEKTGDRMEKSITRCRFLRLPKDRGATSVEYALMASLIALAIIGGVGIFGTALLGLFNNAVNML